MSGQRWIKSWANLPGKPKFRRLVRALGVDVPTAIGHLHLLWWHAVTYAEASGELIDHTPADIADACRWTGEPDALVDALVECRFLDYLGDYYAVHNWPERGGAYHAANASASEHGALGNHTRWHTNRGDRSDACPYCIGANRGANRPDDRPDVAPIGGASRPDAGIEWHDDRPDIAPTSGDSQRRGEQKNPRARARAFGVEQREAGASRAEVMRRAMREFGPEGQADAIAGYLGEEVAHALA